MNFKSDILKLSIIFMLILVLIPVASAMDSEDAFYEEYDCGDDEGFVEEYVDYEVENTQVEVSSNCENEGSDERNYEEHYSDQKCEPQYEDNSEDAYQITEFEVDSVDNIDTIIVDNQNADEIIADDFSCEIFDGIIDNSNDTCHEELTLEKISVNQGSIFISKFDETVNNENLIDHVIVDGIGLEKTSNFNRNLFRIINLKNSLLIRHDMESTNADDNLYGEFIVLIVDNIRNDFAYSIDNSIIGDDNAIFVICNSCFLNFDSCFDAIFCCNFLNCEYFFSGVDALEFFGDNVVEYSFCNILVNILNLT